MENPPYITVLHGVNVYLVVVMEYNKREDEYKIAKQSAGLNTKEGADILARSWADDLNLEIR